MSNQKKAALSFKHVTPQLANLVEGVLGEAAKHTFSVSRLYAAYNGALQKNDKPQTCSSCLRNRAAELKKWYAEYKASKGKKVAVADTEDDEVAFTPETEGAQYGIATKGGVPLPAGNYAHGDQQYAVNGEEGRYTVITGEPAGDALLADKGDDTNPTTVQAYYDKLAELGVTDESSDADMLEGLEVLSTAEGITQEEADYYAAQIEIVSARIAAEGDGQHSVNTDGGLRLAEKGAQGIKFVPNEGEPNKGTVTYADGTKLRAGTYALADGRDLAVQVTGKATIKEEDLT